MPAISRRFAPVCVAKSCLMLSLFSSVFISLPGNAGARDFGEYGKVTADIRYRYETVDDDSRLLEGDANTLRARLGYQTPEWNGLYAFGEVETIRHLGPTDFDDGLNNKTRHARINDPELNALNQLYVHYQLDDRNNVRLGRQALAFGNQRFVAWSKSRQNDPTHDALLINLGLVDNLDFTYAHSMGVHRFSGGRSSAGKFEGNLNLFTATYKIPYDIKASAYTYLLDFDGLLNEKNLSSRTHGLRLEWEPKGEGWKPLAAVEFARQNDYGHSVLSYSENYSWLEIGAQNDGLKISGVVETLGGNGTSSMQTPIGSSHSFTGYADKFSTTPAAGLRDHRINIVIPYDLPWEGQSIELVGQFHKFTSDDGDIDFGTEGGVSLTYKPVKNHVINLKYADYKADDFSSDTTKLLLSYEYKF